MKHIKLIRGGLLLSAATAVAGALLESTYLLTIAAILGAASVGLHMYHRWRNKPQQVPLSALQSQAVVGLDPELRAPV